MSAPDPLPALVAKRNKIWHSNDGDASNPAISPAAREKRTLRVRDKVDALENRIAAMVAPSIEGIHAQFELLMELVELGGWVDNRDYRLIEFITAGFRNLLPDMGGTASVPNLALLLRAEDRLGRVLRLAEAIQDLAIALTETGEGAGEPITEIARTMMHRLGKISRDIEKYRHALPK